MSLCLSLEQNLMDEKQNFCDENYSYIFSSNVHIFWNLLDNFFQKNVNFSQKSSESSASNLRSFEDSSISGNGPNTKTKMDLRLKIFEERRSSKLRCNSGAELFGPPKIRAQLRLCVSSSAFGKGDISNQPKSLFN